MTVLKKIHFMLVLPLLFAAAPPNCRADGSTNLRSDGGATLEQAEKMAQSGEWEKARQAYKTELTATPDPTVLPASFFFNYGTALAKAGATGEAYVTLLRAARAAPFDSDTKHNLRLVESQVPAAVKAVRPSSWLGWWPSDLRAWPWKLWFAIALACSAVAFTIARSADRALASAAAVLTLALYAWGALAYTQARQPILGVTTLAKVKSGPGSTFSDITTLEPGTLVTEDSTRDGWLKIRFVKPEAEEETVGWLEPTAVLRVF